MTPELPTIAHLKGHGLEGLFVTCANPACCHATAFTFAALDLADDVRFPSIWRKSSAFNFSGAVILNAVAEIISVLSETSFVVTVGLRVRPPFHRPTRVAGLLAPPPAAPRDLLRASLSNVTELPRHLYGDAAFRNAPMSKPTVCKSRGIYGNCPRLARLTDPCVRKRSAIPHTPGHGGCACGRLPVQSESPENTPKRGKKSCCSSDGERICAH